MSDRIGGAALLLLFLLLAADSAALSEAARLPEAFRRGFMVGGFEPQFFLDAVKSSGPSPSGPGHAFTDGGIKRGGWSSGAGRRYGGLGTLGGIKGSGPSPGAGHAAGTSNRQ